MKITYEVETQPILPICKEFFVAMRMLLSCKAFFAEDQYRASTWTILRSCTVHQLGLFLCPVQCIDLDYSEVQYSASTWTILKFCTVHRLGLFWGPVQCIDLDYSEVQYSASTWKWRPGLIEGVEILTLLSLLWDAATINKLVAHIKNLFCQWNLN